MSILLASLAGGLFVSDVTAVGQIMISRPIFCAPVLGWLLGDIETGIYIGMIMELIWIAVVPLGNAVPPDPTVVAISGTYIVCMTGDRLGTGYIAFVLLCLVPAGILFKKIDVLHRKLNIRLVYWMDDRISKGDIGSVDRATLIGVAAFFLKAAFFLFIIMLIGQFLLPFVYNGFGPGIRKAMENVFFIMPVVGLGMLINTFKPGRSRRKS
ncbi:MAG: PTS sugar transporter subunit IIC [Elusimicrobiota bacterium]